MLYLSRELPQSLPGGRSTSDDVAILQAFNSSSSSACSGGSSTSDDVAILEALVVA